ncbi:DNA ligase-1 [Catalinimonas alkaloidigena]|uniref:DNA ligase (ATP) n=1 Tax=Catalinimonas alkaloidigena TaxID=1075417 RepID=A0A1G9II65_9BACT|nr:ATP-dependent DNA ligase [Catalinimonas alkaloidigena]SDL24938.1 DNA ligase-1 [Catalinimonas alkaloidigena]
MKQFAQLYQQLDQTNKTNKKVAILKEYFQTANDADKIWTIALFSHRRPRRQVNTTQLRQWATEAADIPLWLFEESYHVVGDLAETVALLLPPPDSTSDRSLSEWIDWLQTLSAMPEPERKEALVSAWREQTPAERMVFTKLLTGNFRIGISRNLMERALAEATEVEKASLSHRLMGNWQPGETSFEQLILQEDADEDHSRPYPFFLAHPVEEPETLGEPNAWQAEWKWDGIRSQTIKRNDTLYIWSRGEELVTDKYPELAPLGDYLPEGTVIDGELLPFRDGRPLPFGILQTRIGRKTLTPKLLKEAPVVIYAYDLLEWQGESLRSQPLHERRAMLERLVEDVHLPILHLSPKVPSVSWEALRELRSTAREFGAEGLMLKRLESPYRVGRQRGDWWKWKVEPLTIDGVLVYAQRGTGRRADLYSDYTFAVWDGPNLVPFTKAYSGLTDAEMRRVDAFVKRNTREKFGPVRTVTPKLVFELAFEGIQASKRHKSGVALRFPRILRWREDKPKEEADTLETLQEMLQLYGS